MFLVFEGGFSFVYFDGLSVFIYYDEPAVESFEWVVKVIDIELDKLFMIDRDGLGSVHGFDEVLGISCGFIVDNLQEGEEEVVFVVFEFEYETWQSSEFVWPFGYWVFCSEPGCPVSFSEACGGFL